MNTRILVILALFVGIGAVLHAVVPPVFFGVKPDMLLAMMFLGIILFPKPKYVLLLALATGVMSALTTGAPGGQIANMIDKPITAFIILGIFFLVNKSVGTKIAAPVLAAVGTIISGTIFLTVVAFLASLPEGGFITLFVTAVLPAVAVNTIIMIVLYPIVQNIMKRSNLITAA